MGLFGSARASLGLLQHFGFRTKRDGQFGKRVSVNLNELVRGGKIDRATVVSILREELQAMAERGLWEAYEPRVLWHFCTRSELAFRGRGWEMLSESEITGVPNFGMATEEGNALVLGMMRFIEEAATKGASRGQIIVELAQGIAVIKEAGHAEVSSSAVGEQLLRGLAPTFEVRRWTPIAEAPRS